MVPWVAGCTSSQRTDSRDTLRLPVYGHVRTLDPARMSGGAARFVASLLYSGLVKFGPDLHVVPDLAVSIPTISTNGRAYTFTIRQDARFDDGRHCTAADVAYSIARALRPEIHSRLARSYLGNIVGAEAVETGRSATLAGVTVVHRLTLRILLAHPDATFLQKLSFPVAATIDPRVASRRGFPWHSPAGTGPWVVWVRDRSGALVLRPRRHYYDGPLRLRQLSLVSVASAARGLELYHKGKLDAAKIPAADAAAMSGRPDFQQSDALEGYYAIPSARGIELAAHINRDRLVHLIGPGLSSLDTLVPPAVPDYVSSSPNVDPKEPARSFRRLGFRLRMVGAPGWTLTQLDAALGRQWPLAARGGVPVYLVRVGYALPDPGQWLRMALGRTRSRWYAKTLRTASGLTNDPVTRMDLYSSAERWALTKGLVLPLASGSNCYLIGNAVEGLQVTPLGLMPANNSWSSVGVA